MAKVIMATKLSNGNTVVLLEGAENYSFDGKIETNIGEFGKGEYLVAEPTRCFSNNNTKAIMFLNRIDCSGLRVVEERPKF